MTDIPPVKCSCQNCHFVKDPGFEGRSICQRFPPLPVVMEGAWTIRYIQPEVIPDGFCGEWRRIE